MTRPDLSPRLSGAEFQRWYWLKSELIDFCREIGLRSTGGKALLAARIAAVLDGTDFAEPCAEPRTTGRQLAGEISGSTVIPAGQRCSQVVRAWMRSQVGAEFHFDASMRDFFSGSNGTRTMQEAVEYFRATRAQGARAIDPQFEYNRFARAWCAGHPDASRDELLAAWKAYRSAPVDERGRA